MIKRDSSTTNVQTTIGVLSDGEVLRVEIVQGRRTLRSILLPFAEDGANEILETLWQAGLTEVWVMPATRLSQQVTRAWLEQANAAWTVIVRTDASESARPVNALLWPKGNRREERRLAIVFPEHAGWNWELSDATSLLATVTYIQQALNRSIVDTPELIARQLLTDLTSNQPMAVLRSFPQEQRDLLNNAGVPLLEQAGATSWMRPLTLVEQRQRYLHKYTHFSLALEACMGAQLGVGAPRHSPNGRAFDAVHPGIWRITSERVGSVFDGKRLPGALDRTWMSTPQVVCCRDIGYQIVVEEGYSWPQSHDLLTHWATTLWQAAENLTRQTRVYRHAQARNNALQTTRRLVQIGIATLAQDEATGGWSRPDWAAQIIGRQQAALFTHLVRLVRKGTMPVLIDGDAFWVVANDPNPLTAVSNLPTTPRWRGYSVGYETPLPLTREVNTIFRTAESASQAATKLDALAGEIFP
jgi:hypothetical protein